MSYQSLHRVALTSLTAFAACYRPPSASAPDADQAGADAPGGDAARVDAPAPLPDLIGVYSDSFETLNATIATATGRGVAIENQREVWGTDFNQADETLDRSTSVIPLISWAVAYKDSHGTNTCASYADILNGVYDAELTTEAQTIASWQTPVMIRFFKEFTDTADDMCFFNTSNPASQPATSGPIFVATWQHVVGVFETAGATNVQWVWGPSANLFGKNQPDDVTWRYFYPGNNYVDWISNDNYNKSDTMLADYSADAAVQNWYALTAALGKPLMQAETGAGYNAELDPDPMTEWITTAYSTVKQQFPAMKAFVWWSAMGQVDYDLQGQGLTTYEAMVADPYFAATDVSPYFSSKGRAAGPAAPSGLAGTPTGTTVALTWTAPGDPDAAIASYNVYRDGVAIGVSTTPAFTDSSVAAGTYHYVVDAIDTAYNRSLPSAVATVTVEISNGN